jgi:NAD(P)H-hydrate epimerase
VTAAVGASVRPVLAALAPEVTFVLLPEDLGVIGRPGALLVLETAAACDALVLGPGLTTYQPAADFVGALLQGGAPARHARSIGFEPDSGSPEDAAHADTADTPARLQLPMVLDADGLTLVGRSGIDGLPAGCVLTPHPGEMARLTGQSIAEIQADRLTAARAAATGWCRVVVLKGALTVVAAPDGRAWIMPFANAALAKAGTGDVLAGALGGFLAQGLSSVDAAVAAAYTHSLAGELAAAALGSRAVTATDVAARLGRALEQIETAG